MKSLILKTSIKLRLAYKCSRCDNASFGDVIGFKANGPALPEDIDRYFYPGHHRRNSAMPLHWGHYGSGEYRCPDCINSKEPND